ncbi:MAG: hypothetical protein Q7K29_02405 [Thermoleophilia bacterium]|nr:hypothetical protein [Thermoleophilia bacterium]
MKLQIAGFPITVLCDHEPLHSYLDRELAAFRTGDGGELILRIKLAETFDVLPSDSGEVMRMAPVQGLELWIRHASLGDSLELKVLVHRSEECRYSDDEILFPLLTNILFSLFLRQLKADKRADVLSIHACGVIREGRSYLFTGSSGVGKSTLALQLMGEPWASLQGDDMIPLTRDEAGWVVHASPLGGDIPRQELSNASAPLAAIFFLSHGSKTVLEPVAAAEAAAMLLEAIVLASSQKNSTPVKMSDYEKGTLMEMMSNAAAMVEAVPCFRLALSLADPNLEEIFKAVDSEVPII